MLNPNVKYYRRNNIVFDANTHLPIISFVQNFPDLLTLSETCINYLNKYIEMFPHLINTKEEIKEEQLTLF